MQPNSYVLCSDLNCSVSLIEVYYPAVLSVFTFNKCSFHLYHWLKGKESEPDQLFDVL